MHAFSLPTQRNRRALHIDKFQGIILTAHQIQHSEAAVHTSTKCTPMTIRMTSASLKKPYSVAICQDSAVSSQSAVPGCSSQIPHKKDNWWILGGLSTCGEVS
jgi:hypothetical protein